jgi:hypothetical protein
MGSAESGALMAEFALMDPGLARIVEAWPELPEAIRKAMLQLAETSPASSVQWFKQLGTNSTQH